MTVVDLCLPALPCSACSHCRGALCTAGDTVILSSQHIESLEQHRTDYSEPESAVNKHTMSDYASAVLGAALLAGEQPLARVC